MLSSNSIISSSLSCSESWIDYGVHEVYEMMGGDAGSVKAGVDE